MLALHRSLKGVRTGKTIPWENVKQDLHL